MHVAHAEEVRFLGDFLHGMISRMKKGCGVLPKVCMALFSFIP